MVQNQRKLGTTTINSSMSVEQQEEIERRFWEAVDRIRERNADQDPEEVLAHVTEVVEEVRRERYEREQREAQDRR